MQGVQIMFQVTNNNLRPQITNKMEVSIDAKLLSIMRACWAQQVSSIRGDFLTTASNHPACPIGTEMRGDAVCRSNDSGPEEE